MLDVFIFNRICTFYCHYYYYKPVPFVLGVHLLLLFFFQSKTLSQNPVNVFFVTMLLCCSQALISSFTLFFSSQDCQTKHWQMEHKFKCKQMKSLDPADKLSCGVEANSKKSSGFGRISLVPACKKISKVYSFNLYKSVCVLTFQVSATIFVCVPHTQGQVLFPYDEFLKLYNWKDLDVVPCGLMNCGNRYSIIILYIIICLLYLHMPLKCT